MINGTYAVFKLKNDGTRKCRYRDTLTPGEWLELSRLFGGIVPDGFEVVHINGWEVMQHLETWPVCWFGEPVGALKRAAVKQGLIGRNG